MVCDWVRMCFEWRTPEVRLQPVLTGQHGLCEELSRHRLNLGKAFESLKHPEWFLGANKSIAMMWEAGFRDTDDSC